MILFGLYKDLSGVTMGEKKKISLMIVILSVCPTMMIFAHERAERKGVTNQGAKPNCKFLPRRGFNPRNSLYFFYGIDYNGFTTLRKALTKDNAF